MSPPELQAPSFASGRGPPAGSIKDHSLPERGPIRLDDRQPGLDATDDAVHRLDAPRKDSVGPHRPGVPTTSPPALEPTQFVPNAPSASDPRPPMPLPANESSPSGIESAHGAYSLNPASISRQTFDSTPPRQLSLRQSIASPGHSSLQQPTRTSPASSRTNSLRRKPPPPLDFSPDHSPLPRAQIDHSESPTQSVTRSPQYRQTTVPETPNRDEEEKDTLSKLAASESPAIELSIPTSNLHFEPSAAELDRDDDTIGSGISYLSSSTSSSKNIEADDQPRPYQPSSFLSSSTHGYEQGPSSRPYQGVGLGLPFSVSAAANLSSLASRAPLSASHPLPIDIPSPSSHGQAFRDPYRSPRPDQDGTVESPVVDRGQLIGLGELATPRWTSAALERRWGAPSDHGNDTDVFDVHDPMVSSHRSRENSLPECSCVLILFSRAAYASERRVVGRVSDHGPSRCRKDRVRSQLVEPPVRQQRLFVVATRVSPAALDVGQLDLCAAVSGRPPRLWARHGLDVWHARVHAFESRLFARRVADSGPSRS